jgi:hypothetical protein
MRGKTDCNPADIAQGFSASVNRHPMRNHMTKPLLTLLAAAILTSTAAVAQTTCEQCGTLPPPPPPVTCKMKSNAGVGNGAEGISPELGDCDPGRSPLHNQAARNIDKPNSRWVR